MNFEEKILKMLEGIQDNVASLQTDVSGLKAGQAAMQEDISNLQAGQAAMQEDIAGLKTDVAGLKTDVAGLKQKVSDMDGVLQATALRQENEVLPKLDLLLESQGVLTEYNLPRRVERLEGEMASQKAIVSFLVEDAKKRNAR